MTFWVVAAGLVAVCLLAVFAPILRGTGGSERRASYDMQIYRDQLREVERDVARGVVTPDEAEATRTEIARKLLAAADAEARETAAFRAPRKASLAGAGLAGAAAVALTIWLYGSQGAPGYPDQPLAERVARAQADAREMAEMVDELQAVLADRPDDLEGHRLLVRSLIGLARLEEAATAQEQVIGILGEEAEASDYIMLAQLAVGSSDGQVSPQAEAALAEGLTRDPANPLARYLQGLALLQNNQPEEAHTIWSQLLEEGPPDAPWVSLIQSRIGAVAARAGISTPEAGSSPISQGAPETTPQAIDGMVSSLGNRLAREGGPPEDWAQLIRSLGVLGRVSEASAIFNEARQTFASDEAALMLVTEAARDARLIQ